MTEKELLKVIAEAAKKRSTELDFFGKTITRRQPEIGQLGNLSSLLLLVAQEIAKRVDDIDRMVRTAEVIRRWSELS